MGERASQTRVIEGTTYTVRQLGAMAGSRLLVRLMKMMSGGADIKSLLGNIAEEDLGHLIEKLAPFTDVEVGPGRVLPLDKIFDTHFAGKYAEMLGWVIFALEANYSDFFGSLPRVMAGIGGSARVPKQPE